MTDKPVNVNDLVFETCTGAPASVIGTLDALGVTAESVGESAALLARMEYTTSEIAKALASRFGLSDELAVTIATEAVNTSNLNPQPTD